MDHNDMNHDKCMMCEKGGTCGGMCRQHHWMHIVIRVAVAILIFWCGVQFGEVKSLIRQAYYSSGYGMMSGYAGKGQNYFYANEPISGRMMGGWYQTNVSTTTK